MNIVDEIARHFASLADRVAQLEQRVERQHRKGTVAEVDAAKHLIRMRIGGTDDEPHLSPWVQYSQFAGARKVHSMPSVGQQMLMISPCGDFEQAFAMPLSWSDANPAPSSDADEHIDEAAGTTITRKGGVLTLKGMTIVLDGVVKLGGADADKEAAMRGTTDSAGDTDVGNLATRVFVK